MSPSVFDRLQLLLEFEISRFEGKLHHLASGEYPSEVGPKLIDQLVTDLESQRADINRIVSEYSRFPQSSYERLQTEHLKLVAKLPYVSALENAQTDRVPWSLVPSIERLASILLPNRELLTTCTHEFNYGIRWSLRSSGIARFSILSLPAIHRINAFLHVLVGHELAHPIVHEFLTNERPAVYVAIKSGIKALPIADPRRVDQLVEYVVDAWQDGLKELMCDMGCVALFGPATVIALSSFASTNELDVVAVDAPFYPPHRYRLRTAVDFAMTRPVQAAAFQSLLKLLREDAHNPLPQLASELEEEWSDLESITKVDNDLKAIGANPLINIAFKQIESVLDRAWVFIESKINASADSRSWTTCYHEIPPLLQSFRMWVPAGEVRQHGAIDGPPASLAAILLSAWLRELELASRRDRNLPTQTVREFARLCGLLLKSLEDSELKRLFAERKVKLGIL